MYWLEIFRQRKIATALIYKMEWLILEVCYKKIISGLLEKSKLSTALYASVSVPGIYFSLQTKVSTRLNAQNQKVFEL